MSVLGPIPSALNAPSRPINWHHAKKKDRRAGLKKRVLQPRQEKTEAAIQRASRLVESDPVIIPEIRVADIIDFVADATGVDARHIRGPSQERRHSWPRQVAMALALNVTKRQITQIASVFGRDHTTLLWARKSVRARCEASPAFAIEFENMRLTLAVHAAQRVAMVGQECGA